MTSPIKLPPKKDPQIPTRPPQLPPMARSRAALAMSAAAAAGQFALQTCRDCGTVCYPPRDGCPKCLSTRLRFVPVAAGGKLIAETTVRASTDLYFRERLPWRVGTVALDCGPSVMAHLHADLTTPGRVTMAMKLDKGGNAVLFALPEKATTHMEDDPQYRELNASPKYRRVLVTDGRGAVGQAVVKALLEADAATVFVGIADPWKPFAGESDLAADPRIEVMALDVTDTTSVKELAGEIGGKTDILINTADHVRPGGILTRTDIVTSRDEFEVNVFGLQRLAQAFGPLMRARGADGVNSAVAFVDILPIHALCNWQDFGAHSASASARLSVLQCLRGEMRAGGVRVLSIFTGPIDDDWRQTVEPPKVAPAAIARAVVTALQDGIEDSTVGDIAKDVLEKWLDNPKVLEREQQA
jgi:NAD(P)-dependent dehydrogenase (short-subunit alcohol dehydrogenase family)/uncharacterized OB-fold protein